MNLHNQYKGTLKVKFHSILQKISNRKQMMNVSEMKAKGMACKKIWNLENGTKNDKAIWSFIEWLSFIEKKLTKAQKKFVVREKWFTHCLYWRYLMSSCMKYSFFLDQSFNLKVWTLSFINFRFVRSLGIFFYYFSCSSSIHL